MTLVSKALGARREVARLSCCSNLLLRVPFWEFWLSWQWLLEIWGRFCSVPAALRKSLAWPQVPWLRSDQALALNRKDIFSTCVALQRDSLQKYEGPLGNLTNVIKTLLVFVRLDFPWVPALHVSHYGIVVGHSYDGKMVSMWIQDNWPTGELDWVKTHIKLT